MQLGNDARAGVLVIQPENDIVRSRRLFGGPDLIHQIVDDRYQHHAPSRFRESLLEVGGFLEREDIRVDTDA